MNFWINLDENKKHVLYTAYKVNYFDYYKDNDFTLYKNDLHFLLHLYIDHQMGFQKLQVVHWINDVFNSK